MVLEIAEGYKMMQNEIFVHLYFQILKCFKEHDELLTIIRDRLESSIKYRDCLIFRE